MSEQTIPKIKKIAEVGETPFYFIEKTESILQGWDPTIKRTIFLFKTNTGSWGYYDKSTNQVIAVFNWKGKAALVDGKWIKMSLYHRVHLRFTQPVSYSDWNNVSRNKETLSTTEAIVNTTNTAYKSLLEQMKGRDENSTYKFVFANRQIQGRNISYVEKVVWVG